MGALLRQLLLLDEEEDAVEDLVLDFALAIGSDRKEFGYVLSNSLSIADGAGAS